MFAKYSLDCINNWRSLNFFILIPMLSNIYTSELLQAQTLPNPAIPGINRPLTPPSEPEIPKLPPPENLLQPNPNITPPTSPGVVESEIPGKITVERFEFVGSTVFTPEILAATTKNFTNKPITFAELLLASDAITKLYNKQGYITSGAYIPANQTLKSRNSVVKIAIIEGSLESIQVRGLERLNPGYVRSRLELATNKPLNVNQLLQALQLLQLDPLIKNISGELAAGTHPGKSILEVKVAETKAFSIQANLNNNRTPSIGTFERQIQLNQANLLGIGDSLNIAYANTDGSNNIDTSYTLPINSRNGTLRLNYSHSSTNVTEKPFDILDIRGTFQDYGVTIRQPVLQTPSTEIALGVSANRRESDIGFLRALTGERLPFPSPGADSSGKTNITALRFFQEWTQRDSEQVIAARSQFSIGVDAFGVNISNTPPDGRFFSWRGQGQWVRLLAPDTLFILRGDVQVSHKALVPLEQIGIGGQSTVRGYRQDLIFADNGFLASAELRYPLIRAPKIKGLLQITPFFDFGTASNNSGTPLDPGTISSLGLGLLWQQNNQFTARLDWGIPLMNIPAHRNTVQEEGLYFSINYTQPF
jgi:hemolysin activation/secretion protein